MHCLYQKDERTLPGNLQNSKYTLFLLFPPSPKCSVSRYLPHFFLLLSLYSLVSCETFASR
jgi:hypothetical protein